MCYPILCKELKNSYIYIYIYKWIKHLVLHLIHQHTRKKMLLRGYLKERK